MTQKHITIRDVAKAAGVSAQTVSRVINNRPDVAPETREHIQQIILELGYEPNIIARSLGRGQSHTLGVIGYGLEYFGSTSVLRGVEAQANKLGYSLFLSLIDHVEPLRVEQILRDMVLRRVDGLIWTVPGNFEYTGWLQEKLRQLPVPCVSLNQPQLGNDVIAALDNRHGARLATQHLLDQGYGRIGIITGPDQWWEAVEREAGWREILSENKIDDIDILKAVGDWSARSGELGLIELLSRNPDLDAVFVSNDQMALGALQAARNRGLRVPDDLGIVGFDDIPEAAYFYPPLTTVQQDALALGALAMDILCKRIVAARNGATSQPAIAWIQPGLVIRESSVRRPD